jgi:hypothetical protein
MDLAQRADSCRFLILDRGGQLRASSGQRLGHRYRIGPQTVMALRAPVKSEQRGFNTRHEEAVMALSADRWLRPLSVHREPANTEPEEYAHLL